MRTCTLLLALAISLGAFNGCQKGLFGDVEGVVRDAENGVPIRDAVVRLDKTNFQTRTDAAGVFNFKHVPVGVFALVCDKPSGPFRETTIPNFRIRTDSVTRITVTLDVRASLIYEEPKDPVMLSSLKPGYTLLRGRYGLVNDTRAPLTNLVMVHAPDKWLVSRSTGLKGCVAVTTPEQALELVRLFTDFKTYFYFRTLSGDQSYIEVRSTDKKPGLGEMAQDRAKKLGILPPAVTQDENYFYVTRFVISFAQNLYRVRERVGFDGQYEILERSLIIPKMDILLPAS
jgi:hypothetical protein